MAGVAEKSSARSVAAEQGGQRPADGEVELTILMPCLNEAETIAVCVTKAMAYLRRANISGEVLIADNGSTDGSQKLAADLGARVVPVPARGYGAALLGGIAAARGKYIIMGDADDSYDFTSLDAFVEKLREGYELVMGNRFAGGIAPGAMPPLHRLLGNPVLSWIGRVLFKLPIKDFHCGLRGFNAASIRELGLVTTGMEFASEMVIRCGLEGRRMTEVPTTLAVDGRTRPPHLKTWRDGWRHLKLLLMYSPKWLFVFPGALLSGLGAALMALLWFGPFAIAQNVVLDANSYAAACFMLVAGVQLVSFGVISRSYATLTGMLPRGARSDMVFRLATVDSVVRIAGIVLAIGLAIFASALWAWSSVSFGALDNPQPISRAVMTGLTFIVISIQLGFGAFMIGILKIPLATRAAPDLPK